MTRLAHFFVFPVFFRLFSKKFFVLSRKKLFFDFFWRKPPDDLCLIDSNLGLLPTLFLCPKSNNDKGDLT